MYYLGTILVTVALATRSQLATKKLVAGENMISLDLDSKPVSVPLDPAYKLLDVNRSNNTARLD